MNPPGNWDLVVQRAIWLLEHADKIVSRDSLEGMDPHLRAWHYRDEGAWCSWTLFRANSSRRRDDRPIVREVSWDRTLDRRRFGSATPGLRHRIRREPTCRVRDALVSVPDLGEVLDAAPEFMNRFLSSPADPGRGAGDASGVEGFGALACLRHEWTGGGGETPNAMVPWAEHLRNLLVRSLEDRGAGP